MVLGARRVVEHPHETHHLTTNQVQLQKAQRRAAAKSRLATLSPADRAARSRVLCDRLLVWSEFRVARVVMSFLPMPSEPDVTLIHSAILSAGQRVCVPRTDWGAGAIVPVEITAPTPAAMVLNRGVSEPAVGTPIELGAIDAMLVPGLAFDESGGRLGRGGGFYDRFITRWRAARRGMPGSRAIGVAFEEQIGAVVPMEEGDARLDALATESRLIIVTSPN